MRLPPHLTKGPQGGPPVGPGRVYSVWDWQTCSYNYFYDVNGPSDAGGWLARPGAAKTKPWSKYGDPIENLLTELPSAAIHIGKGEQAWGEVAVKDRKATLEGTNANIGEGQSNYRSIMNNGMGSADVPLAVGLIPVLTAAAAIGAVVWFVKSVSD